MQAPFAANSRPLKVLVADDQPSQRELLSALLSDFGCEVVLVEDGAQAVEAFERERPDCVLLDAHMPVEDGFSACARIKKLSAECFTPVLIVTYDHSNEALVRCAQAGGDECLHKPVSADVLQAKVRAWRQIGELHDLLRRQSEQLLAHRVAAREEQRLAKALMHHIVQRDAGGRENLRVLEASAENFHGDIVLSAWGPAGRQHVLVGDFTGHGLQAALGALPAADIFYSMTRAGFGMSDILRELNKRLRSLFPRNIFLCACALEVDHATGAIGAWNGGLPPAFVRDASGGLQAIESLHVPLGVLGPKEFDDTLRQFQAQSGERVYVYTDGLIEQENAHGEQFETERLTGILAGRGDVELLFERLEMALAGHRRDQPQRDDVTLMELRVDPAAVPRFKLVANSAGAGRPPLAWSLELRLGADALRELDPRPLLLRALHELQGLDPHREALHLILTELYTNAVDHGVLACESSLKRGPDGFEKYQRQRQQRLETLSHGSVWIRFDHEPQPDGGVLQICVRDDGAGFDPETLTPPAPGEPSGRGLALVRAFCEHFELTEGGRASCALYRWRVCDAEAQAA